MQTINLIFNKMKIKRLRKNGKAFFATLFLSMLMLGSSAQVTTAPYFENFESDDLGIWVATSDNSSNWYTNSGQTGSSSTGPDGAATGTYYAYTEVSSPGYPYKEFWLEGLFDLSSVSSPALMFDYHMYGSSMGTLYIEANTGSGWDTLYTIAGEQHSSMSDPWSTTSVDLTAYSTSATSLRFHVTSGDGFRGDVCIDNVHITKLGSVETSSDVEQVLNSTTPGVTNTKIVKIMIPVLGTDDSTLVLSSFDLNTNGTSDLSDLDLARIYYTGSRDKFSSGQLFGTNSLQSSSYSINGSQELDKGMNYFWLVYDVNTSATIGNSLDAEVTGLTINGVPQTPNTTAPTGSVDIIDGSMAVVGASAFQFGEDAYPGANNPVLAFTVTVTNPTVLSSFEFNTNGTDDDADIGRTCLYYGGTTSPDEGLMDTARVSDWLASPSGTFTLNSNVSLSDTGIHYFYLIYYVATDATYSNILDAEFTKFTDLYAQNFVPNPTTGTDYSVIEDPIDYLGDYLGDWSDVVIRSSDNEVLSFGFGYYPGTAVLEEVHFHYTGDDINDITEIYIYDTDDWWWIGYPGRTRIGNTITNPTGTSFVIYDNTMSIDDILDDSYSIAAKIADGATIGNEVGFELDSIKINGVYYSNITNWGTGTRTIVDIVTCNDQLTYTDADQCGVDISGTGLEATFYDANLISSYSHNYDVTNDTTYVGLTFSKGYTTVTWMAYDTTGGMSTCDQVIEVRDNDNPVANCKNVTVTLPSDGYITIDSTYIDDGSTDNCGVWDMALSTSYFDCSNEGDNSVTLTVYDMAGNSDNCVSTVTIDQSDVLDVSGNITNVKCFGESTGEIAQNVKDGDGSYTYSWSHSPSTKDVTGLAANAYNCYVQDGMGCYTTAYYTVTEPPLLQAGIDSAANITCYGADNGVVDLSVDGGTAPYHYEWSNYENTQDLSGLEEDLYTVTVYDSYFCTATSAQSIMEPNELGATFVNSPTSSCVATDGTINMTASGGTGTRSFLWSTGATDEDLTALAGGNYTVTINDANGCSKTKITSVSETGAPTFGPTTYTTVTCYGATTGGINISPSGGTVLWSNGATTEDLTSVASGDYSVTIDGGGGCEAFNSFELMEADMIEVESYKTKPSCAGQSNGSIEITAEGGTPGYSYNWSTGGTTDSIGGLSANTYNLTVTDANTCEKVEAIVLSAPAALNVVATATDASCYGFEDGTVQLAVTGGTTTFFTGYSYNWDNGDKTQNITVGEDDYDVVVTDANGCTGSTSATVGEPDEIVMSTPSTTDNVCYGGMAGAISFTASGGEGGFLYYVGSDTSSSGSFTGLKSGKHTVKAVDQTGCEVKQDLSLSEPSQIVIKASTGDASCATCSDGTIDLTVSGGTTGYTYAWNDAITTEDRSGLSVDTFSVTVTDANSCTQSKGGLVISVGTSIAKADVKENELNVYPNPAVYDITLEYTLVGNVNVNASLYAQNGVLVKNFVNGNKPAGYYNEVYQVSDLKYGVYYLRFVAGEQVITKKILIIE